jgi:UDP-glucose 4-epimerase
MRTYLVTGGCGFIGVNVVTRLAGQGARVRVLDNLSLGHREDIDPLGVELLVGDIRDEATAAKACQGIDVVIHLAAHTRVIESVTNPELNFEVNAKGTLNMLLAARHAGVKKFIFASTGGAILGEQDPPVHEEMVARPISPYGAGKLAGEAYCSAFSSAYGLNTIALRFSNVYGPYSYHKGSVVAQFFKNLIQGEPLTVYGDGEQTRDFLYVDDLVDAVLLADKADVHAEVFQVASGRETSIRDLISAMKKSVPEFKAEIRCEPARAGEISRNYADIAKARQMLGYDPKTRLEDGLRNTWNWFLSRQGHFAAKSSV